MNTVQRGFTQLEFENRTSITQSAMHQHQLDAMLFTTEANIRYFTGFHTQFWQSPTRPWFVVVPATGKPTAVIPEIGFSGMAETWVEDIKTWASPCPEDDGVSLLADHINSLPKRYGRVGVTLGAESYLRMPINNFKTLSERVSASFVDISQVIQAIRQIKSEEEISKIKSICQIANASFDKIPNYAGIGMSERQICKQFQIDLLTAGADECPYIIAGSGFDGYDSIIMGPTDRIINEGDVLIIDTGSIKDGYFCDFDRNWAFAQVSEETKQAYQTVYDATTKGFQAAKPGVTTTDLYHAMWQTLERGGALGSDVGRLGHGLGMELTETPSITATDKTELKPGMVITLEPGMTYAAGKNMVHEENIVITEEGAEWLTERAPSELIII